MDWHAETVAGRFARLAAGLAAEPVSVQPAPHPKGGRVGKAATRRAFQETRRSDQSIVRDGCKHARKERRKMFFLYHHVKAVNTTTKKEAIRNSDTYQRYHYKAYTTR